jgi:outer membrane murein-binding lipoprotein Lpp
MRRGIASAFTVLCLGVLVTAGCGSSEPEFCSKVDDLQGALDTLKSDVTSGDVSAIESDAQTVRTDVDAVASSAKSDFPSQTSAVQSSVSTLAAAINGLPSSPSAEDLARLGVNVSAVVSDVESFKTATSSECD